MSQYIVTFKEKREEIKGTDWDDISGVQLVVNADGDYSLILNVQQQLDDAANYQLKEHGIEAAYEASWESPNGRTRSLELVPDSMYEVDQQ